MPSPETMARRARLLTWLRYQRTLADGEPRTIQEILDMTEIYEGHGRWDAAHSDLKALARQGLAERAGGRPARWSATEVRPA